MAVGVVVLFLEDGKVDPNIIFVEARWDVFQLNAYSALR